MASLLWLTLTGLVIGTVTRFVMRPKRPGGMMLNMLVGIVGALLAAWIGGAIGLYGPRQLGAFVAAVVGAAVLLFAYGVLRRTTATA
jgi:uncharacterized membrane protein YeaQ/YmgE (transglycosylase-associated protein family)